MATTLPKVVILDWFTQAPVEQEILKGVAQVECLHLPPDGTLPQSVRDAQVVVRFRQPTLTASEIDKLRDGSVLICASVGYDRVDLRAAAAKGIAVLNIPDYCTEEVADSAVVMMMALLRGTLAFSQRVAEGVWPFAGDPAFAAQMPKARRIRGKTLGIIGLGRIGTAVALRAKALGMTVSFYDPFLKDGVEVSLGGLNRRASLEELLRESDVVSVNCNLTEANRHIIDEKSVPMFKDGALLVNTARGPLVSEAALVEALRSGKLSGAGLDVLEKEPCTDMHYSQVPNIIVTPHAAHYSVESVQERRQKAALAAKAALQAIATSTPLTTLRNVCNADLFLPH